MLRELNENAIRTHTSIPIVKKRGRPSKMLEDLTRKIVIESFDFDRLKDDAGVILPKENDVEDELKTMATRI